MALVQYGSCQGSVDEVTSCIVRDISNVRKYYAAVIEWETLPWEVSGRRVVAPAAAWVYGAFQQVGAPKVIYVPWYPWWIWWAFGAFVFYMIVRCFRHTAL